MEQNSSRRDGREFGQTMNKNYRHKRCARSCAARASKKNEEKKKSNINSLTLPAKELEAQEMRPLLPRPRFEEENKKENKIQHHFLDCAAKKPNASDVPALPPAALRKKLSKKQVAAAPHSFFRVVVVA